MTIYNDVKFLTGKITCDTYFSGYYLLLEN